MTTTRRAGSVLLIGVLVAVGIAIVGWRGGDGGSDRSCTRGGYETEASAAGGGLVVVRASLPDRGTETGRMRYLSCEPASGRRIRLDDVSSFEGDTEAGASFSIVADRWILQRIDVSGPTIESRGGYYVLRDGRNGHWLYDNDACTETTTGVEVLADGHLAVACDRLLLFTPDDGTAQDLAQEEGQDLAPPGAQVQDLRLDADGTTLRWTQVIDGRRVAGDHRVG